MHSSKQRKALEGQTSKRRVVHMIPFAGAGQGEYLFHLVMKDKNLICKQQDGGQNFEVCESLTRACQFIIKKAGGRKIELANPMGKLIGNINRDKATYSSIGNLAGKPGLLFRTTDRYYDGTLRAQCTVFTISKMKEIAYIYFEEGSVEFIINKSPNWDNVMTIAYGVNKALTTYRELVLGKVEAPSYETANIRHPELNALIKTKYMEMRPNYPEERNKKLFLMVAADILLLCIPRENYFEIHDTVNGENVFDISRDFGDEDVNCTYSTSGYILATTYHNNVYFEGCTNTSAPCFSIEDHGELLEENIEPVFQYGVYASTDCTFCGNITFQNGLVRFRFDNDNPWLKAVMISYGTSLALTKHRTMVMDNMQPEEKYDEALNLFNIEDIDGGEQDGDEQVVPEPQTPESNKSTGEQEMDDEESAGDSDQSEHSSEPQESDEWKTTEADSESQQSEHSEEDGEHTDEEMAVAKLPLGSLILHRHVKNLKQDAYLMLLLKPSKKRRIISVVKVNQDNGTCFISDQFGDYQFEASGFKIKDRIMKVKCRNKTFGVINLGSGWDQGIIEVYAGDNTVKKRIAITVKLTKYERGTSVEAKFFCDGNKIAEVTIMPGNPSCKIEMTDDALDDEIQKLILVHIFKLSALFSVYYKFVPVNTGVDVRCTCSDCIRVNPEVDFKLLLNELEHITIQAMSEEDFTTRFDIFHADQNSGHGTVALTAELVKRDPATNGDWYVVFGNIGRAKIFGVHRKVELNGKVEIKVKWKDGHISGYVTDTAVVDQDGVTELLKIKKLKQKNQYFNVYDVKSSSIVAKAIMRENRHNLELDMKGLKDYPDMKPTLLSYFMSQIVTSVRKEICEGLPWIGYDSAYKHAGKLLHIKI